MRTKQYRNRQWQTYAINTASPAHTTLNYGNESTYSLLYNLFADRELGLNLVPQHVYDIQSAYYPTVALTYGKLFSRIHGLCRPTPFSPLPLKNTHISSQPIPFKSSPFEIIVDSYEPHRRPSRHPPLIHKTRLATSLRRHCQARYTQHVHLKDSRLDQSNADGTSYDRSLHGKQWIVSTLLPTSYSVCEVPTGCTRYPVGDTFIARPAVGGVFGLLALESAP